MFIGLFKLLDINFTEPWTLVFYEFLKPPNVGKYDGERNPKPWKMRKIQRNFRSKVDFLATHKYKY